MSEICHKGSDMKITLYCYGLPSIYNETKQITFPTRKAEALFFYVALKGSVPKTSLELIFWPDVPSEKANKSLRNTLYYITKAFRCNIFKKQRGVVAFADDVEIILNRNHEDGTFLEGLTLKDCPEFSLFLDEESNKQDKQIYNTLKNRFLNSAAQCKFNEAEAKEQYLKLTQIDPYDEDVTLSMLSLQMERNNYEMVFNIYKEFAKRMLADLHLEPSAELKNIYQTALIEMKNLKNNTQNYFLGRRYEINIFKHCYDNFCSCVPHDNIIITGGIGTGKTTLLNYFVKDLPLNDYIIFSCYEAEKNTEYNVAAHLIRKLLYHIKINIQDLPERYRYVLSFAFQSVNTGKYSDISEERHYILPYHNYNDVLYDVFRYLKRDRRLIFIIDDLDFCDIKSLNLIRQVLLQDDSVFFVFSCHKDWFCENVQSLNITFNTQLLELKNFNYEEVKTVISDNYIHISEEQVQSIYDESCGNPLYLFEICNGIKTGGKVDNYKFFYLLDHKLKTLSQDQQLVLYVASIFFGNIMQGAVAYILKMDYTKVIDICDALVIAGFLKEEVRDSDLRLLFAHEQYRQYIYNNLTNFKKRNYHIKAADYLAAYAQKQDKLNEYFDRIIYHYFYAGEVIQYISYKIKKASSIISVDNDFPEFLMEFSQEYIDELEQEIHKYPIPLELSYEFILLKSTFAVKTCKYEQCLEYVDELLELDTDENRLLKAYKLLISYGIQTYNYNIVKKNAIQALRVLKNNPNNLDFADLLKSYALAEISFKHYKIANKILHRCLDIIKDRTERRSQAIRACVYNYLAYEGKYTGNYEETIPLYKRAISICLTANITNGLPLFYMNIGQSLYKVGNIQESKRYFLKFESLCQNLYSAFSSTIVKSYMALIFFDEKRYELSANYLREAFICSDILQNPYEYAYLYKIAAYIKKNLLENTTTKLLPLNNILTREYDYYFDTAAKYFKIAGLEREIIDMQKM